MRARTVLIILALLCGVAVVAIGLLSVNAPPAQQQAPVHPHMVVAAVGAIPVGTLIKPQDVTFVDAPANLAPGTTFDRDWTKNPEQQAGSDGKVVGEVVGAVTRRRIEAGQPVMRDGVVKPGDSGFLAAVLKPGMRAVTVGVNVVSGAGGLIYPGDHVDLLLTQTFPQQDTSLTKRSVTETVAQDLRVLAIDQTVQASPPPNGQGRVARTVTLEVSPQAAEKVTVASRMGELTLTIRSLERETEAEAATAGPAPAPVAPAAATGTTPVTATPAVDQEKPGETVPVAPTWAGDVSPALKATAEEVARAKRGQAASRPPVLVIRGDKVDETGVH